jgi:anaerobic selenocysteine-containing dehydrogenase
MHPADVAALGVDDGDLVEITSRTGSLRAVVAPAPDVRRGVVSMAHSWGGSSLTDEKVRDVGAPTNRLVSTEHGYDPVTGMPVQSAIPVAVAPITLDQEGAGT